MAYQEIAIDRLKESPTNPRKRFGDIEELTESIREKGAVKRPSKKTAVKKATAKKTAAKKTPKAKKAARRKKATSRPPPDRRPVLDGALKSVFKTFVESPPFIQDSQPKRR